MQQRDAQTTTAFDAIMATANHPVWIVTAVSGHELAGCLVGFSGQMSIQPSRFLVGLSTSNHTCSVAQRAGYLAVHLPDRDNLALAELFGSETGSAIDKFAHCDWYAGPHGLPILATTETWFTGPILQRHILGDHVGMLLGISVAHIPDQPIAGLRYADVAGLPPGHPA
jgi:flavin reductase (DIM6/NTAB) family NADH-FMN oxidoreductase RutF